MSGPVGLDYNVLFRILDIECPSKDDWKVIFDGVRVMESAAMAAMRQVD